MRNLTNLIFKPLFVFFAIILMGCNDNQEQKKALQTFQEKKAAQLKETVNLSGIKNVPLSAEAKDSVAQWSEFLTFQNEISTVQNSSIQEIISSSNNLKEASAGLISTIPPVFRQIPIQARINVLYTKTSVLVQETAKNSIDSKLIIQQTKELAEAFQDLKIQLNEVFLKTYEDFEDEIDKQIQKQDSILQLKKDSI